VKGAVRDDPTLTKKIFLNNLEKALRIMICERLNSSADEDTRNELAQKVTEFIRENVSEYSLKQLLETFTSYDVAIGLFYEYQDAKRLAGQAPGRHLR
jgi:hypothetical protein